MFTMLKAIKRLITSGLKPHSCKLCNTCYVCHECLREKNQIRECCDGVTEEELDILHEELRNNFSLIYPVRKHSIDTTNANSTQTKNVVEDSENCCLNSRDRKKCQCRICGKSFKIDFALTRHLNTHTRVGEKFKCQTCNKCFAISSDLKIHSKIHPNVEKKSRVCIHCDKKCSSAKYLKMHMHCHSPKRSFKCKKCNKSFTSRAKLNIHYKSHASKRAKRKLITDVFSEVEISENENDSFNDQSFTLKNFEPEKSNSEISDNGDDISNLSDQFNLDDLYNDGEVSKNNFQLSSDKNLHLETPLEANDDDVKTSYKAPLVIKLKPSG